MSCRFLFWCACVLGEEVEEEKQWMNDDEDDEKGMRMCTIYKCSTKVARLVQGTAKWLELFCVAAAYIGENTLSYNPPYCCTDSRKKGCSLSRPAHQWHYSESSE